MFKKKSEKIVRRLVTEGVIPENDCALYQYGLNQLFVTTFNIGILLLIGLAFNMILESIVYMLAYFPLRIYAGGYHSRSANRCLLYSIFTVIAILAVIKSLPLENFICCFLVIVGVLIIFLCAPVEDNNKPLDGAERVMYRKKTRIILFLEIIAFSLSLATNSGRFITSITMAIFSLGLIVLLGVVKSKRKV